MVTLTAMTPELIHCFYKEFDIDPDLFLDKSQYKPYVYDSAQCSKRLERYKALGRVYLAVMLDNKPIGEVVLKNIDNQKHCCTMGITMINDRYKGKGYGTAAEKLILKYAFDTMGLTTVFADALITNTRSRHVLEKVGFIKTHQDEQFIYYRCDKPQSSI